jgi:hemerythrin-like domain-containing protein
MDAIETLMNEHRTIERVLDAMTGFADETRRRGQTEAGRGAEDKAELGRFVTFLRDYADAHHHHKEEDVLFEAMIAHGFPREAGPVAVMLHEHDQGRALVRVLSQKAAAEGDWSDEDRQDIADAAHGFSDLLHAHIHKEDRILYPMAEQRLPPDALQVVGEACAEQDQARAASAERLVALADELVARHAAVTHPRSPQPARFSCGG